MQLTCPGCNKKLNLPETAVGKNVRCRNCRYVLTVPAPREIKVPPAGPRAGSAAHGPPPRASRTTSAMRCSVCKEGALQALPPNPWTRHPGYTCTLCNAVMRPPGTTGTYVFVTVLGGFVFAISIGLFAFAPHSGANQEKIITAAAAALVLGTSGIGWAVKQLRMPVPLDARARPSRMGLWIVLFLVGVLIAGGMLFGFAYLLHEM
jgi:hypothetical protein